MWRIRVSTAFTKCWIDRAHHEYCRVAWWFIVVEKVEARCKFEIGKTLA